MAKYDPWLADYDSLFALVDEIMAEIQNRNNLARQGGNVTKATMSIRKKLSTLNTETDALEKSLQKIKARGSLSDKEFSRRRDMVATLQNRQDSLVTMFNKATGKGGDGDRSDLLGSGSGSDGARSFGARRGVETEATRKFDNRGLIDQQEQVMREQDDGLEALQKAIAVQKNLGLDISNEVDSQNVIIDDLHDATDRTSSLLGRETKHVLSVTEKTKTGSMLCIIILLIIALIVVATVPN